MKTKNLFFLLIILTLLIGACNEFQIKEFQTAEVNLNTGLDLSTKSSKAITDVSSFSLTVTASGMTTIERNFTEQEFNLDIEAGPARTFTLEALDTNGNTLFSGSSTVDLTAGETVDVVITMSVTEIPVIGVVVTPLTDSISVGGTTQLTATIAPLNATTQTVTWSSSNTDAATVSTSGLVTAVAEGTATMTATTVDGGFTATSVITVSATYTVSFDSNEGSGVSAITGVIQGSTITAPAPPIKTGFTFDGWYIDVGLTTIWTFGSDTVIVDMTLYAKWTPNTYSIIFDGNGFSGGSMLDQSVDYEETVNLTPNGYSLTDYLFDGWNTASNGSGIPYAENAEYTHSIDGNMTLYAQWMPSVGLNFIQTDVLGSTSPYAGWNWTRYNDTVNSNSYLIMPNSSSTYYSIEVTDGTETEFTSIQLYDTGNWSTATINFYAYVDGVQIGSETYTGDVPYAFGGYNHTFSDSAFSAADMIVIQPLQADGTSPTPICIDDVVTGLLGTIDFESTNGLSGTGTPTVSYTP